jgi:hypothetical protein
VRRLAIKKRYYVDLKQFYEAESAALKAQFSRSRTVVEKLEAENKSGEFVRAELQDCIVTSRVPSGVTAVITVPAFMCFLLPSILTNTSASPAQPDEFLILLAFAPVLLFVLTSVILFAVIVHSLRRLESGYSHGSVSSYGLSSSHLSVGDTTALASKCTEWMARIGFFAAFFFVFPLSIYPITGIYSVVGSILVSLVLLLSEVTVVMRKRACIRILSKFPR